MRDSKRGTIEDRAFCDAVEKHKSVEYLVNTPDGKVFRIPEYALEEVEDVLNKYA